MLLLVFRSAYHTGDGRKINSYLITCIGSKTTGSGKPLKTLRKGSDMIKFYPIDISVWTFCHLCLCDFPRKEMLLRDVIALPL